MKKLLFLVFLSVFIFPLSNAYARQVPQDSSLAITHDMTLLEFEEFFDVVPGDEIDINGTQSTTYKHFSSQANALKSVIQACPDVLRLIQIYNRLEPLSDANWQEYQDGMLAMLDIEDEYFRLSEQDPQFDVLRRFFDIYENADCNARVNSVLEEKGYDPYTQEEILALNLPEASAFSREYFQGLSMKNHAIGMMRSYATKPCMDEDAAVAYAVKHALNPNYAQYRYYGADCTNFISQIVEAGGVKQDVYTDENKGWWHTYSSFSGHQSSRSWRLADTFCRYMGVVVKRQNHKSFSSYLRRGFIIALDFSSDASWDHIGFVTSSDNFIGSYGYYDYKVAQHTTNYHLWTSKPVNAWEEYEHKGATYGRIRC